MNIGKFARQVIVDNPTSSNEELVKLVLAQYPDAKTSTSCIAWYKSDMRKKGLLAGGRGTHTSKLVEKYAEELELLTNKESVKQRIKFLKEQIDTLTQPKVEEPKVEEQVEQVEQ